MASDEDQQIALVQRLQRGGYVIGEARTTNDGVLQMLVGEDWMTLPEMVALASQDSEKDEKY